jgi:ubiquinone/menaquinone biosynthesis C-methylase UbiE
MDESDLTEFFYEIFETGLPRLGPGDDASTRKALDTVVTAMGEKRHAPSAPLDVLDLGCGTGAQTIVLAERLEARILAVDNHGPYLAELRTRAGAAGVGGWIETREADMRCLDLPDGSFDLIWCEGALFVMGFRNGLERCRALLKPGGFCAVTELAWLRHDVPEACREFFAAEYPDMAHTDANLAAIRDYGYDILDSFSLPESAWWDTYYEPLAYRIGEVREKVSGDLERLELLDRIQEEIDIYRDFSIFYGNVFYVMRR